MQTTTFEVSHPTKMQADVLRSWIQCMSRPQKSSRVSDQFRSIQINQQDHKSLEEKMKRGIKQRSESPLARLILKTAKELARGPRPGQWLRKDLQVRIEAIDNRRKRNQSLFRNQWWCFGSVLVQMKMSLPSSRLAGGTDIGDRDGGIGHNPLGDRDCLSNNKQLVDSIGQCRDDCRVKALRGR